MAIAIAFFSPPVLMHYGFIFIFIFICFLSVPPSLGNFTKMQLDVGMDGMSPPLDLNI